MKLGVHNQSHKIWILILLWLFVSSFNLFKAFHIDDTFYLESAKWIIAHPDRPMSAMINWENNLLEQIHNQNPPPLYFYMIAFIGKIGGFNPFLLHLFQSLFALIAIIFMFKIGHVINKDAAFINTLLIVGGVAFVVNQNLMIDVPLLSLWLVFFICY